MEVLRVVKWSALVSKTGELALREFRVSVLLESGEHFPYQVRPIDIKPLLETNQVSLSITVFADDELDAFQRVHKLVRKK